jgi:glycine oxidase
MGSTNSSTLDLAIVGGGIIGLSVAWRARSAGMSVAVLERDALGGGATHVAAGMLAPVAEVEFGEAGRRVLELGVRSARMWPSFAEELERASGVCVGLRRTGTLVVARDDDEARELERQLAFRESLGVGALRLRASEARELEPALAPALRLALHAPQDHSVDPRGVVVALRAACEQTGVQLREHTRAIGLELDAEHRVVGVRVADGPRDARPTADVDRVGGANRNCLEGGTFELVRAGAVVVAAGAWSGGLTGLPAGVRVEVRPVKGQIMRLRDPAGPGLLERVVRFEGGYLVPRGDGGYVLGATMEERGFEPGATVGGVYELLRDAHELVPGVSELHIEELGVGYRPGTPDNAPVIGRGALPGLTWASGHHRNGILLAPLTAELVMASLSAAGASDGCTTEDQHHPAAGRDGLTELLASCDPGRFRAPSHPVENEPVPLS